VTEEVRLAMSEHGGPDQPDPPDAAARPAAPLVVTAAPVVTARIAWVASAFVLGVFVIVAIVMKRYNSGASFNDWDQVGTVVIGVILAGLLIMPTRPRMRADATAVRLRAYLGGWRVVPWDVIVGVEFPSKVRFARLVLPGEETLAIYAIQRTDRERSVEAMRGLRALLAENRPEPD
jgi:Bacterial PH domain